MKKGWEVDDYVNYVKVQMGGSIVNLACEQDLPFIVEKIAFEDNSNMEDVVLKEGNESTNEDSVEAKQLAMGMIGIIKNVKKEK